MVVGVVGEAGSMLLVGIAAGSVAPLPRMRLEAMAERVTVFISGELVFRACIASALPTPRLTNIYT